MKRIRLLIAALLALFLLLGSSAIIAQNITKNKTSCFANVVIQDSMITVWVADPMQSSLRMRPQVFYDHVFYNEYPFTRFCTQMDDIKKDVERIKQHLSSVKIKTLSKEEQLKLLEEMALSLIWNNLFKIPQEETEQKLAELEKFKSKEPSRLLSGPVKLVNHLYHQVFDGI